MVKMIRPAKKKIPPVSPKPAAKVDEALGVLLAPKPPPPFRSGNDRPIEQDKPSHIAVVLTASIFLAIGTMIFAWLYFHAGH